MSGFLPNEPTTFMNIKLTDAGRRLLSLGKLTFATAALSDREINYGIDRTGTYSISSNRVLAPKDVEGTFSNFDGSTPIPLGATNVSSLKQIITATTSIAGMFTGSTNSFAVDSTKYISKLTTDISLAVGTNTISTTLVSGPTPTPGQLIYIPWEPPQNSNKSYDSTDVVYSANPTVGLWYRISSVTGPSIILDRPTPNFTGGGSKLINIYTYPFNGVDTYYSTAYTSSVSVWNMNIVRTSSVAGTQTSMLPYTRYGSIEYNGVKQYLGFSSDTKDIGVIHYTNLFTGNTYAEQLLEKTVELNLPNVMWHKYPANNGQGLTYGLKLSDAGGDTVFDTIAQTSYRYLRDGTTSSDNIVGRVYHKLKIAVITDYELLQVMTYKANRNYTLPMPSISLTPTAKYPLNTSEATGLTNAGYTYYVTYLTESDAPYAATSTFGYPKSLPCGYVQKIQYNSDEPGHHFLAVNFPINAFPYLRSSANLAPASAYSGTGWNANRVQLLVNEVSTNSNYNFDTLPENNWRLISTGNGNGIYSGETGDLTVDPLKLNGYQFVVSRQDYDSGSTYSLDSVFTQNSDVTISGLTFGSESFFFGTFKSDILATSFKTSIIVLADSKAFNSSLNNTFQSGDLKTYITEVGIFSETGELVAVGKPTYPISKSNSRFLSFKLEYDF